MENGLRDLLERDHARLDGLLRAAGGNIDPVVYEEFRAGLLRHIGLEEKILLPAARRQGGDRSGQSSDTFYSSCPPVASAEWVGVDEDLRDLPVGNRDQERNVRPPVAT